MFRVRHDGSGGSAGRIVAEYYDGGWKNLQTRTGVWCMQSSGAGNCHAGHATEAHADNQSWFDLNAPLDGEGVNHSSIILRRDPNVWSPFIPSEFSEGRTVTAAPYSLCSLNNWNTFRVPRGTC